MGIEEIATKADLEQMKRQIIDALTVALRKKDYDRARALTFEEAREYLGDMPKSTLRTKTRNGEIACCKTGKQLRFLLKDLDAYLMKTRRMTNDEVLDKAMKVM